MEENKIIELVVDGIIVTCYTNHFSPVIASLLVKILSIMSRFIPSIVSNIITFFTNIHDSFKLQIPLCFYKVNKNK